MLHKITFLLLSKLDKAMLNYSILEKLYNFKYKLINVITTTLLIAFFKDYGILQYCIFLIV